MAAHVVLSRDEIQSILSLYHLDPLEDFGGIDEGAINTAYWVQAGGRRYFLRLTENKRLDDMIFEKELLLHLDRHALPVPRLLRNVAKGTFTLWSPWGRYVSMFQFIPGRPLGVFEIRPKHARVVGRFAAQLHNATREFRRRRVSEFDIVTLDQRVERLRRALEKRRLARRFADDVAELRVEVDAQLNRAVDHLPRGIVHGGLFLENARFQRDALIGVVDFEHAAYDRLLVDLAVAVNAWCWRPSPKQNGGPAGRFDLPRVRAMIQGYHRIRPLSRAEQRALPSELRRVALHFALARLIRFELRRPAKASGYEDYRHFAARLRALKDGNAEQLIARVFRTNAEISVG